MKKLLIFRLNLLLICVLLLIPLISHAFISFPNQIDTLQESINIQTVLNTVMTPSPNLKLDGVLGKVSIQTIQAFQESMGLTPDGKVGALTRSALERAQTGNTTIYTSTNNTTTTGCSSGALFNTQTGTPCTSSSTTSNTSIYTSSTNNTTTTGCSSGALFNTQTGTPCTSQSSSSLNISRTLKLTTPRMIGDDIKELQVYLNNNGYNTGTPDGVYGSGTQQAIIKFQQSKNLTPDGSLGPKTLSYMNQLSINNTNINITTTLPQGCLSSSGFNTINGQPCNTNITTLPQGCLSFSGFSTITGISCSNTIIPIVSGGGSSGGGGTKIITSTDTTLPIVTLFTVPSTYSSLIVPVTLTATDNIEVTSYNLTETNATPTTNWATTIPTFYIFTTEGTKTLYAWARDAAGNISTPVPSTINIAITANPTVPGAPTSVTATAGNAQATVSFTTPSNNGGSAITSYIVTSSPGSITKTGTASPIIVTGLTNNTAYTFTVKATNIAGSSVASSASSSVTPMAPVATTFTLTGPSSGNVNSASTNFTITPNNLYTGTITITPTGLSAIVKTFSNSSTSQTFTITPTVAGIITLTPSNNGGLTNSSSLTYTANAVVPGAPTSVTATAGNAQATVSFTTPSNNGGSAITSYIVTSSPGSITKTGTASPIIVTGLTNNTAYTFTVKATNIAGSSVASSASSSVTPILPTDTTKPIVDSFSIPSSSTSLTISPITITAHDNVGVTGYLLTETSSTPLLADSGWTSSAPTTYTFGSVLGSSKFNFTQTIKQGTTSEEVKQLQIYLNNNGYSVSISGPGSIGKETSYFGSLTKQAVTKYQQANKLTADGIIGPKTREVLNK